MEFLLNDLSIHGQFDSDEKCRSALVWLMGVRQRIEQQRLSLRCHRSIVNASATSSRTIQEVIQGIADTNQKRGILAWLASKGPFWDDERRHGREEYFAVGEEIVTDTAIGEAASAILVGLQRTLVSLSPSRWECTPIEVSHVVTDESSTRVFVSNLWNDEQLDKALREAESPLGSWADLVQWAVSNCRHLVFAENVIEKLDGWPFVANAAEDVQIRLKVLNRLTQCFTDDGGWNDEGLHLYRNHFGHKKAWFTDSSDGEKHAFASELTFNHPSDPTVKLFCPWHGKVKIRQLRIHFSYPITPNRPVYVVYIGPKITKR